MNTNIFLTTALFFSITFGAIPVFADNNDPNINGCFSFFKAQDFLKAIEFGKKAINSSPNNHKSHLCLGISYSRTDKYTLALEELKKAEKLATEKDSLAGIFSWQGGIYISLKNNEEAFKYHNQALALRRELEDSSGISTELNNLATLYSNTGQKEKALEYYQQSLDVEPDKSMKAGTYSNIGAVYLFSNRSPEAEPYFKKALDIAEKNGDYHGQATYNTRLGQSEYFQYKFTIAKEHLLKGRDMAHKVTSPVMEAIAIHYLGNVTYQLGGEVDTCMEYFNQSISIFKRIGLDFQAEVVQQDIDSVKEKGRKANVQAL